MELNRSPTVADPFTQQALQAKQERVRTVYELPSTAQEGAQVVLVKDGKKTLQTRVEGKWTPYADEESANSDRDTAIDEAHEEITGEIATAIAAARTAITTQINTAIAAARTAITQEIANAATRLESILSENIDITNLYEWHGVPNSDLTDESGLIGIQFEHHPIFLMRKEDIQAITSTAGTSINASIQNTPAFHVISGATEFEIWIGYDTTNNQILIASSEIHSTTDPMPLKVWRVK